MPLRVKRREGQWGTMNWVSTDVDALCKAKRLQRVTYPRSENVTLTPTSACRRVDGSGRAIGVERKHPNLYLQQKEHGNECSRLLFIKERSRVSWQ